MQNLIELYEMVSMNDAALGGSEKMAILRARFALGVFVQAMKTFKRVSADGVSAAEASLAIAA
jgi:hypothetical protein